MVKQILPAIGFVVLLSSCSTFKPLNFTSNRQVSSGVSSGVSSAPQARFIDDITVTPQTIIDKTEVKSEPQLSLATTTRGVNIIESTVEKQADDQLKQILAMRTAEVESASSVQLKYAVLMNTEVESLPNKTLLENVDEWYGVRYRTGGNTKTGVDCSGFTGFIFKHFGNVLFKNGDILHAFAHENIV